MVQATNYTWHRDSVRNETDAGSAMTAAYVRRPNTFGSLVSEERVRNTFTHSYDALGSTTELTDANEMITDSFRYSAFGETVQRSGATRTPYAWVGKTGYQAEPSNVTYVRSRSYLASHGRWLSRDPTLLDRWDFDDVYRYANNSPAMLIDPSGWLPEFTNGKWTMTLYWLALPYSMTMPPRTHLDGERP